MEAWWAEETSLKNIKNLAVQKLLTGIVHKWLNGAVYFSQAEVRCQNQIVYKTDLTVSAENSNQIH